jgi:hypothetical protein
MHEIDRKSCGGLKKVDSLPKCLLQRPGRSCVTGKLHESFYAFIKNTIRKYSLSNLALRSKLLVYCPIHRSVKNVTHSLRGRRNRGMEEVLKK